MLEKVSEPTTTFATEVMVPTMVLEKDKRFPDALGDVVAAVPTAATLESDGLTVYVVERISVPEVNMETRVDIWRVGEGVAVTGNCPVPPFPGAVVGSG